MTYYPLENDGSKPEESDWENAQQAAELLGGDPIDYFPFDNDGSMPSDYLPPEVLDYDEPVKQPESPAAVRPQPAAVRPQPAPVRPQIQHTLPAIPLTPEEEYLAEYHASDYAKGLTVLDVPYIPKTASGESALFGDRELHDALGLESFITATQDVEGQVHETFHPELIDAPFASAGHVVEPVH